MKGKLVFGTSARLDIRASKRPDRPGSEEGVGHQCSSQWPRGGWRTPLTGCRLPSGVLIRWLTSLNTSVQHHMLRYVLFRGNAFSVVRAVDQSSCGRTSPLSPNRGRKGGAVWTRLLPHPIPPYPKCIASTVPDHQLQPGNGRLEKR